jgi:hypothetical protein
MKQCLVLVLGLLFVRASVIVSASGGSPATLHICNRGFCYNKREEIVDLSVSHTLSLNQKKKGNSFSDRELYAILSSELFEDGEAVECLNCPPPEEQPNDTTTQMNIEFQTLEDDDLDQRRSWREQPIKGKCMDTELDYLFPCALHQVLE